MLLSVILFALFLAGFWLYCLTDAALTPATPVWPKRTWVTFIALTFIVGAIAWVIERRRIRHWPSAAARYQAFHGNDWPTPMAAAIARHPATRSLEADQPTRTIPKGPDDDPEFLSHLDRLIRGE